MTEKPKNESGECIFSVQKVIRETPDAITLIFDSTGKNFDYYPGQYIALIIPREGKETKRYYSLTSSPYTDPYPSITVKKHIDGKSSWLFFQGVKPGLTFKILGPFGTFTPNLNAFHEYRYVFFAGGPGITPIISMIKSILYKEPKSSCTLVYQNRNQQSIIFKELLDEMETKNPGRFKTFHVLSQPAYNWPGRRGRINRPKIADILTEIPRLHIQQGHYYICGPERMEKAIAESLKFIGVPETNIYRESY